MPRSWLLPLLMLAAGDMPAVSEEPGNAAAPPGATQASEPTARKLDPRLAEMCANFQCVFDLRITLKDEEGKPFDRVFEVMPVVQPEGVSVYAGHEVLVEADVEDGRLVNLRRVEAVTDPSRTISSRLEQDENGNMMLVTRNPFDKPLRIRMGMMPMGHDGLFRTSSCPVRPGMSTYEMWSHPIFQIYLGDMRLLEEGEDMACIE